MIINTLFSIQEHHQKRNKSSHYDLRILDIKKRVLWSWAIPKMKFPGIGEKVLAIKTVDHPISYMYFSGKLSNGDTVLLYDKGKCKILLNVHDIIIFYFEGAKIKGAYNFIKLSGSEDAWLVVKSKKFDEVNKDELKTKRINDIRKSSTKKRERKS